MTVTVPLIALVALVAWLAYRYMGLRVWHAVICLVLGFLLAATAAAPDISQFLAAAIQWLAHP
jgi:hypothetical protein